MTEREQIVALVRRRVEEADQAISEAPDLDDGGGYRAALEGRWRGLHELLCDLDPSEPRRIFSNRTTREVNQITERRSRLHRDG